MDRDRIERETVIDAPIERVWEVLTEAQHLGRWFGDAGAQVELRPNGRMLLHWTEHGTAYGRVERVDPPRFFSYRWVSGLFPGATEPADGNSTLVEFTLEREGEATRLRVVESGFALLEAPEEEQRTRFELNEEGWEIKFAQLEEYVQRAPAQG